MRCLGYAHKIPVPPVCVREHKIQLKYKALNRILHVGRPLRIERYRDTLHG